jgi:hypothetical protein
MKRLCFFIAACTITAATFAQSNAKFGLKGGLNIATTTNSQGGSRESRLGLNAGGLAHIHLAPQWALQPEVVFSSQGAKYTVSDGEHQLVLNYINIPLQLQYMFDNGFRIQTGPQVGFLVDTKDKRGDQETGFFTSEDFKNVDAAWSFGLGYLTYSGLGIDGRYNLGISNINNTGTATVHNNVIQIGLFYLFDNAHKAKSR